MGNAWDRRGFLRNVSLAGGAMVMGPWDHPEASNSSRPGRILLNILQTTDVHCQLRPHDEIFWEDGQARFRKRGGYATIAAFMRQQRKKFPYTFAVDTGDTLQGGEISAVTHGEALLPILDAVGYDLVSPGNWEVIHYKSGMQKLMGALKAPKICANMFHDAGSGKAGELIFPPYRIWTAAGVRVGFIGYTDPLVPTRQPPALSKGIVFNRPEESLASYVKVLRDEEHCDLVIVMAHLGLSQQIDLANQACCEGVDYILGGDTHERVRTPIACAHAKVVEPGSFGSFVGCLRLTTEGGRIVGEEYVLEEMDPRKIRPDEDVADAIDQAEAPYRDRLNHVLGHSTVPLYRNFVIENTIDTLILDAVSWKMKDVDIILSNGFRFCPPRATPDHTGHIPITEGFLFDMLPLDAHLRMGKVKGNRILPWLEKELNNVFALNARERVGAWLVKFRGMEVEFLAHGETGSRVRSLKIRGEAIDPDRMYTVCSCEREGDPPDVLCRMREVTELSILEFTMHELMRDYIVSHSPVTPLPPGAAKALDVPATLLTQVSGISYQFR